MPSTRLKIRPWYYIDRSEPSRAADDAAAIASDWAAVGQDMQAALDWYGNLPLSIRINGTEGTMQGKWRTDDEEEAK